MAQELGAGLEGVKVMMYSLVQREVEEERLVLEVEEEKKRTEETESRRVPASKRWSWWLMVCLMSCSTALQSMGEVERVEEEREAGGSWTSNLRSMVKDMVVEKKKWSTSSGDEKGEICANIERRW
jgi:hypothetical protein